MVNVKIAGADVDGGNIPRPLQIVHGRADVGTQPDPPSMEFEWWDTSPPGALGDTVEVWDTTPFTPATYDDAAVTYDDPSSVYDSTADGTVPRQHYAGTIVGLQAVGHTGQVRTWEVATVGGLARWGVTPVKTTRPVETDTARVAAIAAAAGYTVRVDGAPGVTLAAGEIDTDAMSAVHDVCLSSGGLLWQDRTGLIRYTTAAYRQADQAPDFAIAAHVIVDAQSWDQQVEDIINRVVVSYGPADARGETIVEDLQSQAQTWGMRAVAVDTQCQTQPDASALGALIVARRGWPFWGSVNALAVLDHDTEVLFTTADVNTVVMLPIPPTPGPTPSTPAPWVVEGWVEEWTEGMEHTAALAVSDQRRWVTTTLRTYTEVLDGGSYSTWLAAGNNQYLDLLVKGA